MQKEWVSAFSAFPGGNASGVQMVAVKTIKSLIALEKSLEELLKPSPQVRKVSIKEIYII